MAYGFHKRALLVHHKIKNYQPVIDKWNILRRIAADKLAASAREKLEWIMFYHTITDKNVSLTANHFGISRKTLHKWLNRFDSKNLYSLEETTRRPKSLRSWMVTAEEEERIVNIRKQHIRWGKQKLKNLYKTKYGVTISTWKIERVIRKYRLFYDAQKHHKQVKRSRLKKTNPKQLITNLPDELFPGHLWHVDAVIINWYGSRRVIFTGIEHFTRLGMARIYTTNSSLNAADFLKRLVYVSSGDVKVIHSDNGSEFAGMFEKACQQLSINQVYSRVRMPKDNSMLERFNRTLQEEWLALTEVDLQDISLSNQDLLNWLIEYNHERPHQSLDYLTPLQYAQLHYFPNVLPMYSASTRVVS